MPDIDLDGPQMAHAQRDVTLPTPAFPERVRAGRRLGGLRLPGAFNLASLVLGLGLAALILYPLLRIFIRLFLVDGRVDFSAFAAAAGQPLALLIRDTLLAAGASAICALALGSLLAWLSERTDASLGVVSENLPLLTFLLPPIAGAIGWLLLLSPRAGILNSWLRGILAQVGVELTTGPLDIHSWAGLIFVYTIYMVPYVYLLMRAALSNFDPSLEEQSRICGAGKLVTLARVTLPALAPSLAGSALLLAWFGLSLYSVPAIIAPRAGIEVLSVRIVRLTKFTYPPETDAAVVLSVLVLAFVVVTWLLMRRTLRANRSAAVGGKASQHTRLRLGRWRLPARLLFGGYVLVAAVLPILALCHVALTGFWSTEVDPAQWDIRAIEDNLIADRITFRALQNSVTLGVVGATLGIAVAGMVAVYIRNARSRMSTVIDASIKLPASMPNMVIALGFVLAFAGAPFNLHGSMLILLLAYLAVYMPQASVAADTAAAMVGRELTEASHVSGVGSGTTFLRISTPLMLPGIVAGWALLFSRMMGDLNASAILSGGSNLVAGFRILDLYQGSGSFAVLAVLATALVCISSVVILLATLVSKRAERRFGRKKASRAARAAVPLP